MWHTVHNDNTPPPFGMKLEEFAFTLPEELIAQHPSKTRDDSRMMVVHRKRGSIECRHFYDLPEYLSEDDLLVINDSKVIPARLFGKKPSGGMIEILLLATKESGSSPHHTWEVLLRPAKRVRKGTKIMFADGSVAEVVERTSEKKWILAFRTETDFDTFLEKHGRAPLPPYIKRDRTSERDPYDLTRYQTIYAKIPGSVAAPTAGLHFSPRTMRKIEEGGATVLPITLHVGYGTFLPIETEFVEDHVMEEEFFELTEDAAKIINTAKRITAVGTTSTRVLEAVTDEGGTVTRYAGATDLFIYPGYHFKKVDRLITNFHLPRSSLFLLVCAFAGRELMLQAYGKAIKEKFRFYSYGDCMLIL